MDGGREGGRKRKRGERRWLMLLQGSPNSARIAKERLQIILSQQRGASSLQGVDVANMQHQIREVVAV